MTRVGWAPLAAASGPAQWQRITSNSQFVQVQTAYRAYIDHGRDCATCAVDSALCSTAQSLWSTYKTAPAT